MSMCQGGTFHGDSRNKAKKFKFIFIQILLFYISNCMMKHELMTKGKHNARFNKEQREYFRKQQLGWGGYRSWAMVRSGWVLVSWWKFHITIGMLGGKQVSWALHCR